MKLPIGTIIAVAAALIFYLRLIIIQRQKVKRMKFIQNQAHSQSGKVKKKAQELAQRPIQQQLGFVIVSWYMVAASLILVLFGALISYVDWFGPGVRPLWWIPVSVGFILFSFSVR